MAYRLICADILEALTAEPTNSFDGVLSDPPYGLEFMGKEWDAPWKANWQNGGGFSKPGIGERKTAWPSFSANSRFVAANPTCATCGGRARGAKRCSCETPDWKPIGKRKNTENEGLSDDMTGSGKAAQMVGYQAWCEAWAVEVLRVLKPGAFALFFGGTRTYHRLACALEDAGFEIRDSIRFECGAGTKYGPFWDGLNDEQRGALLELLNDHAGMPPIAWNYGSGFPKSRDIGKDIEKLNVGGIANLKITGHRKGLNNENGTAGFSYSKDYVPGVSIGGKQVQGEIPIYEINNEFAGYGTALKPSWEPVIVAMKPLDGSFAGNALKHGVAGLNIDGSRIGDFVNDQPDGFDRYNAKLKDQGYRPNDYARGREGEASAERRYTDKGSTNFAAKPGPRGGDPTGRWPANLILDEESAARLDAEVGDTSSARANGNPNNPTHQDIPDQLMSWGGKRVTHDFRDTGGPSRYFYTAKASNEDRGRDNTHPTVKPVELTTYLAKLILPPQRETPRRMLCCFSGSGSEMIGADIAGWDEIVGIEKNPEYLQIAKNRFYDKSPLFSEVIE